MSRGMEPVFERIEDGDTLLALIMHRHRIAEGIEFHTDSDATLQLGSMRRPRGYRIAPHLHVPVERSVRFTQEVLLIQSGVVRVDFYDEQKRYLRSATLTPGDIVLLVQGGHGFEFLEEAEMIEIKQGPYAGERDKERFQPAAVPEGDGK